MAVITSRESAALQEFIRLAQLSIGDALGTVPPHTVPRLFRTLSGAVPEPLTPIGERIVRDVFIQVVWRLEGMLGADSDTRGLSRRLAELSNSPLDRLRLDFTEYLWDLEERLAKSVAPQTTSDARISRAIAFINENYARKSLALADVADSVRVSRWHLDRLFRRHTGRCFIAHLHEARLTAARALLADGLLSMKEIAFTVGYSSATSFDRHFKQHFGSSPTVWRRQNSSGY